MSISAMLPNLPKGRAKACTSCRQVKLKCNAREVFPAPCSRCKTQRLECKFDSTFRRVPARRQLEEVSTRLNNLQRSLGLDEHTVLSASAQNSNKGSTNHLLNGPQRGSLQHRNPAGSTIVSDNSLAPREDQIWDKRWLMLENSQEGGSWPLGNMHFEADTIISLFRHFDKYRWPHTPFLEPCKSLHELYQSSTTLFWTILLVACRDNQIHNGLYSKLQPYVQAMLSAGSTDLSQPLKTLHAILLICLWPFPTQSQSEDPAMIWVGLAANIAMMKGLHKPGHEMEYGRPLHPYQGWMSIRKATWLVVFQISTSQSSWFGVPPMLNSTAHLDTIASLCKDPLIPRDLAASADIQRQIARYMTTLDCQLDPRTKSSLIKLCEQDLDLVRKSFEDIWSGLLEIELLGAKIYIYGMSFVSSTADDTDLETEISSLLPQDFLQCGLAAAVRLLYTARHLKLPAFPSSTTTGSTQEESKRVEYNSQLVYYPKHLFRLIAFANFFLLWFLAVDFGASEKDKELARNYVTATHRLFKSFEQSPEHVRYGKMIEVIGRMPNIANLNGSLRVTSRLGASFMYDIIRNSVLYREASRHAQDVHVPLSTYQENNGALSSELPQEASLSHQTSLSYSVSDGTSPGLDQDTQMPYFQEDSSGRFASFDQGRSPNSYQDSAPNADFPWGLWDDAVYDSLHMETNLSQLPPDANINIRQ